MPNQYKPLTIKEHVALGNAIKTAWNAVIHVPCNFPKASRVSARARRAEKALLALKSALDEDICRLVRQQHDPRHLATRVYYGPPFVKSVEHTDPQDAFAGWVQVDDVAR